MARIQEEITKKDVEDIVRRQLKSSAVKSAVEKACEEKLKKLFRDLWQRSTFWTNS